MSVLHLQAPGMPWFRFEWHPTPISKVYVVRVASSTATTIADNIQSQAEAELAANAFLNGYREKAKESSMSLIDGDGPRHHRIIAETGHLGLRLR